ncbi:tryptophan halogenase family protein [Paraglaciecola sp. MB-3u-78]|uniref:tryptophan halogenase family protein n=1 Tax=Paraglaciecola sp. MB-3u-78 TaxID=2058332 RepID=UPI000C336290|nr:tryptophan halogenase family protein [Paraglaciecola sp. MB-3u-78]PKG98057.1 tryptophan halogenase [Paraglaciecola sp. MB-3u-78]
MKTRVVIVGGGTAGWLTAGIIAARHCADSTSSEQTEVVLVESPEVKNLGVGEGTWPTMRDTLRQIGISERMFLSCCDASFKQASKFVGWSQGKNEHYYHPFTAPVGYGGISAAEHWLATAQEVDFESWVCAQGAVCKETLAPKLPQMPEYAFHLNYGYHLNAGKFVTMLQHHCVEKLSVKYIQGHVQHVLPADNGDIKAIELADGEQITGELFIDCSGFAAILIAKHYQIPITSKQHILFNDTALALQVDHATDEVPIASCTVASAQESGWIWDIALQNRRGIGHVFSSDFTSAEQAEQALLKYVQNDPYLAAQEISPRTIKFTPGHRETFWHHNCVAIGVSAGFVEPLEATALVLIEKSAEWISEQLPRERSAMTVLAKRFNTLTRQRWQEIIDFLKLHYVLTQRQDSEYWREHQQLDSIPDSLQEALTLWRSQAPGLYESNQRFELFSSASKQYVLYGMDLKSEQKHPASFAQKEASLIKRLRNETVHTTEKLLSVLPTNRQFLRRVMEGQGQKK